MTPKAKDVPAQGAEGKRHAAASAPHASPERPLLWWPLLGCSEEVTRGAWCHLFSRFYQKLGATKLIPKRS